jgi:DNA-directed RNA polymerase subunit RPC12/RpoP
MPETLQRNNNPNSSLRARSRSKKRPSIYGTEPEQELSISPQGIDFRCSNCKERNYFIELPDDSKNAFCKNCGHRTPRRTMKYLRGIAVPNIQQDSITVIQPSKKARASNRKPASMRDHVIADPTIEAYAQSGSITIIDSQTNSV